MWKQVLSLGVLLCAGMAASAEDLQTQPDPLPSVLVDVAVDSGVVRHPLGKDAGVRGADAELVYSTEVTAPGASWLRLWFDRADLAGTPGVDGSYLIITSLEDGAWQRLDGEHIHNWSMSSAYFNGDSVLVELWAYPGTGDNRVALTRVMAGEEPAGVRSICDTTDDRVLSYDPRVGRLSSGCTGWLIDHGGSANRLLTAGHCISNSTTGAVMFFNVPLSSSSGAFRAPPPEYQYPVQNGSIQSSGSGGVGNDMATFQTHSNSNTGLAPMTAQGSAFVLASAAPSASNQPVRVTGFGLRDANFPQIPQEWSRTQKTHAGPFTSRTATAIRYRPDTTGGNSGSPVILESTGQAIGIHTHGGCNTTGGSNAGTTIEHPTLQSYLASPLGTSIAQAPFSELSTTFASNNGGSVGGAVYFDVAVGPASQRIRALELNIGSALSTEFQVSVYRTAGTAVGKQLSAGQWTLVGSGSGVAAGTDEPTRIVLTTPFVLQAGESYGLAVVLTGAAHRYTNATASNTVYHSDEMTLTAGSASSAAFGGSLFNDRVFNGRLFSQYVGDWIVGNMAGNDQATSADLKGGRIKAMGFTMPAGQSMPLGAVGLRLEHFGPQTNPLVRVYSGAAAPTTLLGTLSNPPIAAGLGTDFFTPATPLLLNPGTTYWLVVSNAGPDRMDWMASNPALTPGGWASHAGSLFSTSSGPNPPSAGNTSAILNSYAVYVGTANPCAADINGDGLLNFFDISQFVTLFQSQNPAADFNNDGLFNFFDFSAFLAAFNAGCP